MDEPVSAMVGVLYIGRAGIKLANSRLIVQRTSVHFTSC